jgi:hypothetical protein
MKRRALLVLVAGLVFVSMSGVVGCKKHASDPFPASNAVAGWEKAGETRTFAAKDLWQYIDGDAEQYVAAGVASTSTSDYKFHGTLEAVVDVYTMGNAAGAQTVMNKNSSKEGQSVQLGDAGLAFAQSVSFRKGAYFVKIVAYDAAPGGQQALLALAHGIEAKL